MTLYELASEILGKQRCGLPDCECHESWVRGRGPSHCPFCEIDNLALRVSVRRDGELHIGCKGGCSLENLRHILGNTSADLERLGYIVIERPAESPPAEAQPEPEISEPVSEPEPKPPEPKPNRYERRGGLGDREGGHVCRMCRVAIHENPYLPQICESCLQTHSVAQEAHDEVMQREDGLLPTLNLRITRRGEWVVHGHVLRHFRYGESKWDGFGDTPEWPD